MIQDLLKHLMIVPSSPTISILFALGCFYHLGYLISDKEKDRIIIAHIFFVGAFLAGLIKGLIK